MLDNTKFDTVYAILEAINKAAAKDVQAYDQIQRLVDAAQCVMTDLPIRDSNKRDKFDASI